MKTNTYGSLSILTMASNGDKFGNDIESDSDSGPESPAIEAQQTIDIEIEEKPLKSSLKPVSAPAPVAKPPLPPQTNPEDLDLGTLTPLTPEIGARQATIYIGTIGHVAHG